MGRDSPPRKPEAGAAAPEGTPRALDLRSVFVIIGVGAAVVVVAAYATALIVPAPRPEATLQQTVAAPDDLLLRVMESEGEESGFQPQPGFGGAWHEVDLTTLSAFGRFRGFEIWSAVNAFGSTCLIAYHPATADIVARSCVPAGADLFVDTHWPGVGPGERLRFLLRGDTVEAFVLRPAEVD